MAKREPNLYFTDNQNRLVSSIFSHVRDNLVWDDFIEGWRIGVNGEDMWVGEKERNEINVVLRKLYRLIDGV